MATESNKESGKNKGAQKAKPRVISTPKDVANLVMMQIDHVNARKDDLTIAVKGLADTARQLARAYAQQQMMLEKLAKRVKELEKKD
jgi:hypothetical protein